MTLVRPTITAVLCLALVQGVSTAADPGPGPAPVDGPKVTCNFIDRQLRVLNPRVFVGQPLLIALNLDKLKPTDDRIEFMAALTFGRDIRAFVHPPAGPPFEFKPENLAGLGRNNVLPMRQSRLMTLNMLLATDNDSVTGALFDRPGKYTIEFYLTCRGTNLPASEQVPQNLGTFAIEVVPPEGDDQKAVAILSDPSGYAALQSLAWETAEQKQMLERIVAEAPKSALAPLALVSVINGNLAHARSDVAAMRATVKLNDQFLAEHHDHPFARDMALRSVEILLALGDKDGAREAFVRIWTDPTFSPRIMEGDRIYNTFLTAKHEVAVPTWDYYDPVPTVQLDSQK